MIALADNTKTPADIIAPMFDRSGLPDVVQLLEDKPKQGLKAGALFTWSDKRRAYTDTDGRWCVLADYVRARFFSEFNYAPPQQTELF